MGQSILLAQQDDRLRSRLKSIFIKDPRVNCIYEAKTYKDYEVYLHSHTADFVVANQTFITSMMHLPQGNFAILTPKLDMAIFKEVYKHRCRGYLSENASAELLLAILDGNENTFLIDSKFTPHIIDKFFGDAFRTLNEQTLTPREKEIVVLLRKGLDRPTIARKLCIAEATLKTHIKNIARKREV